MQQNKTIPLIKRAFTFLSALFFISMAYGQTRTIISGQISNLKTDTIKILLQINSITRQTDEGFPFLVQFKNRIFYHLLIGLNHSDGRSEAKA